MAQPTKPTAGKSHTSTTQLISAPRTTNLAPFETAADAVKIKICQCLDASDLFKLVLTSKTLKNGSEQDQVWKEIFLRVFPGRQQPGNFKMAYKAIVYTIDRNFRNGAYTSLLKRELHRGSAECATVFRGLTISGGYDKTVQVLTKSAAGLDVAQVLSEHTDKLSCLGFDGDHLFTGSRDKTLKVWKVIGTHFELVQTLDINASGIQTVAFNNGHLFVGTDRGNINIWEKKGESYEFKQSLNASPQGIVKIEFDGDRMISASHRSFKVYKKSEEGFEFEKEFPLKTAEPLEAFAFNHTKGYVVTGSDNGDIEIWKKDENGGFVYAQSINYGPFKIRNLAFVNALLVSVYFGSRESFGEITVLEEGNDGQFAVIKKIKLNEYFLNCHFHNGAFVISKSDGSVGVLDFSSDAIDIPAPAPIPAPDLRHHRVFFPAPVNVSAPPATHAATATVPVPPRRQQFTFEQLKAMFKHISFPHFDKKK